MTEKRAVGRPTKYNDKMQEQADAYLFGWDEFDAIPSRVGLCCFLGIDKTTSYDWEEKYPEFSHTCKAVEALQERTALNKGITGDFNSQITKLVLANHGYSDRIAQDHSSSDGSMTPKPGIDTSQLSDGALEELMRARRSQTEQ